MKQENSDVLDEKDEKLVQLFFDLGMPKNLAKTLLYVYQVDECRSAGAPRGEEVQCTQIM